MGKGRVEVLNFRRWWFGCEAGFVGCTGSAGLLGKRVPSMAEHSVYEGIGATVLSNTEKA